MGGFASLDADADDFLQQDPTLKSLIGGEEQSPGSGGLTPNLSTLPLEKQQTAENVSVSTQETLAQITPPNALEVKKAAEALRKIADFPPPPATQPIAKAVTGVAVATVLSGNAQQKDDHQAPPQLPIPNPDVRQLAQANGIKKNALDEVPQAKIDAPASPLQPGVSSPAMPPRPAEPSPEMLERSFKAQLNNDPELRDRVRVITEHDKDSVINVLQNADVSHIDAIPDEPAAFLVTVGKDVIGSPRFTELVRKGDRRATELLHTVSARDKSATIHLCTAAAWSSISFVLSKKIVEFQHRLEERRAQQAAAAKTANAPAEKAKAAASHERMSDEERVLMQKGFIEALAIRMKDEQQQQLKDFIKKQHEKAAEEKHERELDEKAATLLKKEISQQEIKAETKKAAEKNQDAKTRINNNTNAP